VARYVRGAGEGGERVCGVTAQEGAKAFVLGRRAASLAQQQPPRHGL
jgi:hypothetical protein